MVFEGSYDLPGSVESSGAFLHPNLYPLGWGHHSLAFESGPERDSLGRWLMAHG